MIDQPVHENARDDMIGSLLEQLDSHICRLAHEIFPHDDRVDDLIQLSRIKFWQAAKVRPINNPKAYLRWIVKSAYVDILRKRRYTTTLPMNEEGELSQGKALFISSDEMRDPLEVVEDREEVSELLRLITTEAATFPYRQKQALICKLKDCVDDPMLLREAFRERNVDIDTMSWPTDAIDRRNLVASVAIARRRMKTCMKARSAGGVSRPAQEKKPCSPHAWRRA